MLFRYISRQASRRVSILRSPLAKESTTGFVPKFIKFQTKAFASSSLSDLIQREIADESQNELNEMPSHLSDLHKQISSNWTIVDGSSVGSNSGAVVNMYKKEALENGAKVTVSFHCQDTMDLDGLSQMLDEDDDLGEEASNPLRFEVRVVKAGMNMRITCETHEAHEASCCHQTVSPRVMMSPAGGTGILLICQRGEITWDCFMFLVIVRLSVKL